MPIHTVDSDIFDSAISLVSAKNAGSTIIIPHVCNNIGIFGAGFAAAVRNKFPSVATNFELMGKKTKLGYVQYISVFKDHTYDHDLIFANMIAQNGIINNRNTRPLNYEYLVRCMIDVREFIKNKNKDTIQIRCPKFGSGLAGGDWRFISDLIEDIWININVIVHNPRNRKFITKFQICTGHKFYSFFCFF